jgi:hypothetical protein
VTEPRTQVALLPEPAEMTPMQMLQIAVAKGVDTAQLEHLMALQREWKTERAREAFHHAMNAFRAEAISIVKTKQVSFKDTHYKHATLADIVTASVPALSKHGLSHRWETKQEGSAITVACVVTHELGHSAQTSLTAPPDTSGSKNSIQAIGSTVSYLQRYTFMAITGLAAKDQDDDGRKAEVITADQATVINDKLKESNANKPAFFSWLKVESVEAIAVTDYARAIEMLDNKIAAKAKK